MAVKQGLPPQATMEGGMSENEAVIACTLDAGSYQERLAWIRGLMARSLRESRRDDTRLHLTFDATARGDVETLVRQEKACCSFLGFTLVDAGPTITLTIEVPAHAADAANELLAPFLPEAPATGCGCGPAKPTGAMRALLGVSVTCGIGALACAAGCVLAPALALAGVTGAWLEHWDNLAPWRVPILIGAIASLGIAWVLHHRSGGAGVNRSRGLWLATALVAIGALWGWIEPVLVGMLI
jgi:hypothetical protein